MAVFPFSPFEEIVFFPSVSSSDGLEKMTVSHGKNGGYNGGLRGSGEGGGDVGGGGDGDGFVGEMVVLWVVMEGEEEALKELVM